MRILTTTEQSLLLLGMINGSNAMRCYLVAAYISSRIAEQKPTVNYDYVATGENAKFNKKVRSLSADVSSLSVSTDLEIELFAIIENESKVQRQPWRRREWLKRTIECSSIRCIDDPGSNNKIQSNRNVHDECLAL